MNARVRWETKWALELIYQRHKYFMLSKGFKLFVKNFYKNAKRRKRKGLYIY